MANGVEIDIAELVALKRFVAKNHHHPTAIGKTLDALKQSSRHQRIFVVLEFASYTMRTGVHVDDMAQALAPADGVYVLNPSEFNLSDVAKTWRCPYQGLPNAGAIVDAVTKMVQPGDAVLVMSNRGFDNIHQRLTSEIDARFASVAANQ